MVGLPYDCLANPLGAVRLTFDKAVASGTDPAAFDGKDWGAIDLFHDFLYNSDGLSQVPLLNPYTIRRIEPNTLVRYRGMIQDMLGNEFYVGAYKDEGRWGTNKFSDVSQFPMGASSDMRVWERRLLYCVPVPGQNLWTESSLEAVDPNLTSTHGEKRRRDDDQTMDDVDMQVPSHELEDPCTKKMRESEVRLYPSDMQGSSTEGSSSIVVAPPCERSDFPCLVKIYDAPESDLKLNDVFEFVGVLTYDLDLMTGKEDESASESIFCEDEVVHLPPSKVPRLHCLAYRKLAVHDFLSSSPTFEVKPNLIRNVREALLGHLTTVLGNDDLAANFMLLHLLSKVYATVDTIAVGKLSLNLTGFGKEIMSIYGNRLNLAVRELLPFTNFMPLTVDYLNSVSLAPKKDYQANRLVSGMLQLAEGSHLTIDETLLRAGTLNSTGVENARLLKSLMELQKVEYDFTYYKMEMKADIQLLILSEGKSNILPADIVLPFCPSAIDSPKNIDAEEVKAWRWYLGTMRSLPHSIDSEMQKVVEDDLVAARQADRSLGSQEFSRWLTMGRLVSLSFGESMLSVEHWQIVKELNRLRRERIQGAM